MTEAEQIVAALLGAMEAEARFLREGYASEEDYALAISFDRIASNCRAILRDQP